MTALFSITAHYRGSELKPFAQEHLMREVYKMRYDVYCRECEFLNATDYPDWQERDEYDAQSAHFASFDHGQGLAGYVRLVRPDAIETFPFQNHCVDLLDGVRLPPAEKSAEISRLMVRENLRRRTPQHHNSPQVLLSLYREMYEYSTRNGIRYWYAAMERSLARALKRMHFGFQQIGPATNYYGPVAPYVADLRDLESNLSQSNPGLLAWMQSPSAHDSRHELAFGSPQVC